MTSGWRAAAGDLLLGSSCHGCGVPAWSLCAGCRVALDALAPRPACPEPCPAGFPRTWAAGPYDALHRGLVSAHKDRAALGLAPVLGERLAVAVLALLADLGVERGSEVVLVPVPSARRAVRTRGYDAGLALARAAAARLPETRAVRGLVPARRVADQSGLDAQQRHVNLAGAFRVRPRSAVSALVVVVDDLVTSGASLAEATRALRADGVRVLGAATVAATARRRPVRSL